jgi:hypothetical protein
MLTLLFNIDNSLLELISKGVIGLSTFLSLAAFYLIWQEQKKPNIRTEMMSLIKIFLSYNLASIVIVGLFTLPTYNKNKELNGSLTKVHEVQQIIQSQDIRQGRLLDSLSRTTSVLQDSISWILTKNNLTKEKTNAIAEIKELFSQQKYTFQNLQSDSLLASDHKKGLDSIEVITNSIKSLVEKSKTETLNVEEKSTLIKKTNEINNKIIYYTILKNLKIKEALYKKIEKLSEPKSKDQQ